MLEGECDLLVGSAVEGTWLQAVWFGFANRQRGPSCPGCGRALKGINTAL